MIDLGRFGGVFGLAGLVVLSGGPTSQALADSFYLKNGEVIDGTIVRRTLNTLTLKVGGAIRLTSSADIERIVLTMADGSELDGELVGWEDGIFELRVGGEELRIADGEILEDEAPSDTATAAASGDEAGAPVEMIAMRTLPSFALKNGSVMVGKILHATGSVLTIRPDGGSAFPVSKAQVVTVSFESDAGDVISGKLLDWDQGVYHLQLDDRELQANLPDDAVNLPPPALQARVDTPEDEATEATPVVEGADAAILPSSTSDAPEPAEGAAGGPANETAVAAVAIQDQESADQTEGSAADAPHLIEAQVDSVDESSEVALFKFQLDKPAARPLVVLYAATDASAKAGEDFEAKSGVITFATGSSYAEVKVPIIDDDRGEESEQFNLFLSGDPGSIAFSERQIAATINDND